MNAAWIDTLARAISRRQALRLLTGGLGGTVKGRLAPASAVGTAVLRPSVVAAQESSCPINTIELLVDAFIPKVVAGVTGVVPRSWQDTQGPPEGSTMVLNPNPDGLCVLTDQRGFTSDLTNKTTARMRSMVMIDVEKGIVVGAPEDIDENTVLGQHTGGETISVLCNNGQEQGRQQTSTDNIAFKQFVKTDDGRTFFLALTGSLPNPIDQEAACAMEYRGEFTIKLSEARDTAEVKFDGSSEGFPAFAVYANANLGPWQTVLEAPPAEKITLSDLCKETDPENLPHPLRGEITLRCDEEASNLFQYDGSLSEPGAGSFRCGTAPCTSGTLNFQLGLAPSGEVTALDVTVEAAREVPAAEGCGVASIRFAGHTPGLAGWGAGDAAGEDGPEPLYLEVRGTLTEQTAGPSCDPAQPTAPGHDEMMPFSLHIVDGVTLVLCPADAVTRADCLARPVAKLTRKAPVA